MDVKVPPSGCHVGHNTCDVDEIAHGPITSVFGRSSLTSGRRWTSLLVVLVSIILLAVAHDEGLPSLT
jgi:hypothetical protein